MAKVKYDGREFELIRNGTFQEASDVETESGVQATEMTNAQSVAMSILISLRRGGIAMSWTDIMTMDADEFDIIPDPKPDPTDAAPARVPQDRKARKAPARRGGAAGGSQAG